MYRSSNSLKDIFNYRQVSRRGKKPLLLNWNSSKLAGSFASPRQRLLHFGLGPRLTGSRDQTRSIRGCDVPPGPPAGGDVASSGIRFASGVMLDGARRSRCQRGVP